MVTVRWNHRSARALMTGGALLACPIAAAQAPLALSIQNGVQTSSTIGTDNAVAINFFSSAGPFSLGLSSTTGYPFTRGYFYSRNESAMDVFFTQYATTAASTASGYQVNVVTVLQSVIFQDVSSLGGTLFPASTWFASSWTADGVGALTDGQVLTAGVYTFRGTFTHSGTSVSSTAFGFGLTAAPASVVPLPGAAGLAACALAGFSRRRRHG